MSTLGCRDVAKPRACLPYYHRSFLRAWDDGKPLTTQTLPHLTNHFIYDDFLLEHVPVGDFLVYLSLLWPSSPRPVPLLLCSSTITSSFACPGIPFPSFRQRYTTPPSLPTLYYLFATISAHHYCPTFALLTLPLHLLFASNACTPSKIPDPTMEQDNIYHQSLLPAPTGGADEGPNGAIINVGQAKRPKSKVACNDCRVKKAKVNHCIAYARSRR